MTWARAENDWSLARYHELVESVLMDRPIYDFRDVKKAKRQPKAALWRHDVEVSLSAAEEMAKLDAQIGIRSTFFFLVTSEYNLFEREQASVVDRILTLGHSLGLHYDPRLLLERHPLTLDAAIASQREMLEGHFGQEVVAISAHIPGDVRQTKDVVKHGRGKPLAQRQLKGCIAIDAYNLPEWHYVSDSGQLWREDPERWKAYDHLHVLTHPDYWSEQGFDLPTRLLIDAKARFDESWLRSETWMRQMRSRLRVRAARDRDFKK